MHVLLDAGAKINVSDHGGNTALMFATKHNDEHVIAALVSRGAVVNRVNHDGMAASSWNIVRQDVKIAMTLIRAGADVSQLPVYHRTMLCASIAEWRIQQLQLQHVCQERRRWCLMAKQLGKHIQDLAAQLAVPNALAYYVADAERFVLDTAMH